MRKFRKAKRIRTLLALQQLEQGRVRLDLAKAVEHERAAKAFADAAEAEALATFDHWAAHLSSNRFDVAVVQAAAEASHALAISTAAAQHAAREAADTTSFHQQHYGRCSAATSNTQQLLQVAQKRQFRLKAEKQLGALEQRHLLQRRGP